jgi:4-amino-4-deoxy-L-arabinose transferase-like glycosyltransferase
LIYAYGRTFLSRTGAFTAAVAYPSMGQVLQIGRLAETEGLFTLLVAGSLLVWHWGYTRGWPAWQTWSAGYALAALAGLTKGPQGLIYFVSAVGAFLLIRRDWRTLLGRGHFIGAAVFLVILAAWQIPFCIRTGWDFEKTRLVWTGLASNRFVGYFSLVFATHLVRYPLEIVVCTLPWSLMLPAYALPRFRRTLGAMRPHLLFLAVCLAVTFPSVWFAPYARGRYYMPLYPVIAVLVGIVADRCLHAVDVAGDTKLRAAWWRFNVGHAIASGVAAAAVLVGWTSGAEWFDPLRQSAGLVIGTLVVVAAGTWVLWVHRSWQTPRAAQISVLTAAAVLGAWYTGLIVEARRQVQPDIDAEMAELRRHVPADRELVSFGRLHHAFLYHYGRLIPELPWPPANPAAGSMNVAAGDVFCVSTERLAKKPLPFAWEPLAEICCEGRHTERAGTTIIGRRLPTIAAALDTRRE